MIRNRFVLTFIAMTLAGAAFSADKPAWTPAHSMKFRDIASVIPSPDGKLVLWTERWAVMTEDKSEYRTHIFLGKADGASRIQLTRGEKSADAPQFSADGQYIYFTSERSGKNNVYRIATLGGEAEQLTDWKGTLSSYAVSPDGKSIAFVGRDEDKDDEKRKKSKLDFKIINDTPRNASVWIAPLDGELPAKAKKLIDKPYHSGEIDWSPDGKKIAFVHRPRPEADHDRKADIAEVEIASGQVTELQSEAVAESSPRYSPDGRFIAFARANSTNRLAGNRIALLNLQTRESRVLSSTPDEQPQLIDWAPDSKSLILSEISGIRSVLMRLPVDGPPSTLFDPKRGTLAGARLNATGTHLGFTHETPDEPREAYVWKWSGDPVKVSAANSTIEIPALGKTEVVRWKSKDGREVEGLLTYPVGYQSGKKVPLILNIHGGPSGAFLETFTGAAGLYPIAAFAERGYAVLRPNPRGSTGYGTKVRQMVVQDWGGRDFEDLMTGVDHVIAMGVADPERMAVMGWSYGGYMTAWTVTQTNRFKAAAIGAGITNHVSMYGTEDIPTTYDDYFGGAPWDFKTVYLKSSPMEFVSKAQTPTLILHGEQDERVPVSQAYEFHRALERRNVPVKMIVYPRQPHGPREPKFLQHVAEQHLEWADKYLRDSAAASANR